MDSDVRRLLGSFDSAMRGIHSRWLLGKFRFLLGPQWGYKKACEEVHEVIEKFIDRAMCKHRSSVAKGPVDEVPRKCVLLGDLKLASNDLRSATRSWGYSSPPGHHGHCRR